MLGMIKNIEVIKDERINIEDCEGLYDGYQITTDKHVFRVFIDNAQRDCEQWGYFASEAVFDPYIGNELKGVHLTDMPVDKKQADAYLIPTCEGGGREFVNFIFMDGRVLQFVVYNNHNGFHAHQVAVIKDDALLLEETL